MKLNKTEIRSKCVIKVLFLIYFQKKRRAKFFTSFLYRKFQKPCTRLQSDCKITMKLIR
jgi:hypothetical protein